MATTHPGSDYYVSVTGTIQAQANPALALGLRLAGWSGPYTYAQAKTVANNVAERTGRGYLNSISPVGDAASQAATSATTAGAGNTTCLVKIPIPGVSACLLSKTQARAIIGGLIIGISAVTVIVGLALITVDAFEHTGAARAAGKTLDTVSMIGGPVGTAVRAGAARARRQPAAAPAPKIPKSPGSTATSPGGTRRPRNPRPVGGP